MIYSILITTKNRLDKLQYTLSQCEFLLKRKDTEFIICDDGSTDGTFDYIQSNFPSIELLRNNISKGLIYSRNRMLAFTTAKYAISLDDDSHFPSNNPLKIIESYFKSHPKCSVQAFRIFWGKEKPGNMDTSQKSHRVKGYVGCGHAWRMSAWNSIPDYPYWFIFYGEEEFASYQLLKNGWQVHYVPEILVHHRVEVSSRKSQKDYGTRLRRSLRSGWYNYFLFLPWSQIPKRFFYTLYIQFKLTVLKGDLRATIAIFKALMDLILHLPKLISNSNRLTKIEFKEFQNLENTKVYWSPHNKIDA